MKKPAFASVLILGLVSLPLFASEQVLQAHPVRIVTSTDPQVFSSSWRRPNTNIQPELLPPGEHERMVAVLNKATRKYPQRVLSECLEVVYVFGDLRCCGGLGVGGSNTATKVYINNRAKNGRASDEMIEHLFHAEFSSALLLNYPQHLDQVAWRSANSPSFQYGTSGLQAIKANRDRKVLDPALNAQGFLHEYAMSLLENDFNSIATHLFLGSDRFWAIVDKYPAIATKTELTIAFYHRIDPRFTKALFLSFAAARNAQRGP